MQIDAKNQVYAGFFVRLAAFLVDMIIVNVGLVAVRFPMWVWRMNDADNVLFQKLIFQYSLKDILIYGLTAAYFVLMTYYTGSTLGKKLFALRVISVEDRKMTFFEVLYRETIGRFLSDVVFCLGYLFVIVQKDHRGLHDLLSDTCVIYYHEKKIYVHTQMNYRNMAPQPGFTVPSNPENGMSDTGRDDDLHMSGNAADEASEPFASGGNAADGANQPFVSGGNAAGGASEPFVSGGNAADGANQLFVSGGNAADGANQPFVSGGNAADGADSTVSFTPAPNHQEKEEHSTEQTEKPYVSEGYFSFDDK